MMLKNVSAWRRKDAVLATFFRTLACSRTIRCAAICNMAWRRIWRRSLTSWWRCLALRRCLTACRAVSPAEKNSGWRLAGRCLPPRNCCCWMSRWRRWISRASANYCPICSVWRAKSISRCCTSATLWMRFSIWRITSWCWKRGKSKPLVAWKRCGAVA